MQDCDIEVMGVFEFGEPCDKCDFSCPQNSGAWLQVHSPSVSFYIAGKNCPQ